MKRNIKFKEFTSNGNIRANNYEQILCEVEEEITKWVNEENPIIISIQLRGVSWMSPYLEAIVAYETEGGKG